MTKKFRVRGLKRSAVEVSGAVRLTFDVGAGAEIFLEIEPNALASLTNEWPTILQVAERLSHRGSDHRVSVASTLALATVGPAEGGSAVHLNLTGTNRIPTTWALSPDESENLGRAMQMAANDARLARDQTRQ